MITIKRMIYILGMTCIGMFALFYSSINIYWAQTYHTDSPFVKVAQWIVPAEQTEALVETEEEITQTQELVETIEIPEIIENEMVEAATITLELEIEAETIANVPEIDPEPELEVVTLPEDIQVQSGDKIFFVGDSLMQGVAPRAMQDLYQQYKIEGIDLSKQSTGLSYPSFFDWPKVVEDTLNNDDTIKALFVFLGPNDPWDMPVKGQKKYLKFKSEAWENSYRERIQRILTAAEKHHVRVVWFGAPCMRKTKLHKDMVYLNGLYESEVLNHHGRYIPTSELLGCSDEKYSPTAKRNQRNEKMRTDDGIHFTVKGQRLLAEQMVSELVILPEREKQENEEINEKL